MFYNHTTISNAEINLTFSSQKIKDIVEHLILKYTDINFQSEFQHDISTVIITVYAKLRNIQVALTRIKISATPANCGSLLIHELWTKHPLHGFGTHLLNEVENWAINSGYTMIHCNVPKYNEIDTVHKFFEKKKYKLMGDPYINVRSGNLNQWYYKILQLPQEEE